ncbi:MAG: HAMP domain-containing histidine kinase [Coriobacteriales bacterium]|nr:HAMP domain-containing histidine kinase [Coriobacteriales bacterium]
MKLRYCLLFLMVVFALGVCGILFLFPVPENPVDLSKINDMIQRGQIVDKTVFADAQTQWQSYHTQLQIGMITILFSISALAALFLLVLYRRILRPFQDMRRFAKRVAAGELAIPLEMDRHNAFGAFTESFDLMRDELQRARDSEQAAGQSKRELVASLSHDIQTPVASIKAVAELMALTAEEDERQKLQIIQQKTGQIHTLVTDLFHTTLNDLDALPVNPVSFPSSQLAELLVRSDYLSRARIGEIPGCLLEADAVRLAQVIDNIVANSYKYADTTIEVTATMDRDGLALTLRDFGPGAAVEELPLLCSRYYRGAAAQGKSGYGLGMYVSRMFMERMGGRLECFNAEPGFAVRLWLRLDS